jgi:hypothetical protein
MRGGGAPTQREHPESALRAPSTESTYGRARDVPGVARGRRASIQALERAQGYLKLPGGTSDDRSVARLQAERDYHLVRRLRRSQWHSRGTALQAPPADRIWLLFRPGFTLPPLMFPNEIDAIVLGLRMVARIAELTLTNGAHNALARIMAVLPAGRGDEGGASGLLAGAIQVARDSVDLTPIRNAIRTRHKIWIAKNDETGVRTERRTWPNSLTFCARVRLLARSQKAPIKRIGSSHRLVAQISNAILKAEPSWPA